jgi:transposase
LRFLLTAGQRHDVTQVSALIDGFAPDYLIADRGYDADALLEFLADQGIGAVIPARKNRKETRAYDVHLYKERHLVECFINKIKYYRRIFSRFDKLAGRYLGFISLAASLIWLH